MRLVSAEKLPALISDERAPSGMRLCRRVKGAQVFDRSTSIGPQYVSARPIAIAVSSAANPFWKISVVTLIPLVLLVGCFAQIVPTIICRISVFVINGRRPFSCHHKPDYAVSRELVDAVQRKPNVSIAIGCTNRLVGKPCVPSSLSNFMREMVRRAMFPNKMPRLRIVSETLGEKFFGWQPLIHRGITP